MCKEHALKKLGLLAVLVLVALFSFSQPVQACNIGPGDIIIIFHGDGTAWVIIFELQTVGDMEACAAALAVNPEIARLTDVFLVNSNTGKHFAGLNFRPNAEIQQKLEAFTQQPRNLEWQSFSAEAKRGIQGGIEAELHFELQLQQDVTPQDFVKMFRKHSMVSSGSAAKDGSLTFQHFEIAKPHAFTVMIEEPDGSLKVMPEDF